jgi:SAM-dependent methyltransferase
MEMNFTKSTVIHDSYLYQFYGLDTKYESEMVAYAQMAKRFMNKPFRSPLDIVGNYDWHEAFPYEQNLFFDKDEKLLVDPTVSSAVDFGCGPGRMVNRTKNFGFKQVDGIDISEYAIEYARNHFPDSTFYVSSGIDVGQVPDNTYDIAYSTIAIQHIPCKTIRMNIVRGLYNCLKPGGYVSLQVAYHPTMTAGVWSHDTEHASYDSDFWNAKATNGHADMVINLNDLATLRRDFGEIFSNVSLKFENVSNKYANLGGHYHAPYWAQDWLFIQGQK